jgi:hypothetical protein
MELRRSPLRTPLEACPQASRGAECSARPLERADRNYGELLQELRIIQTGVQILFGLGFLGPLWWVAAAVLVFGATRYGRGGGGGWIRGDGSDLGDYRD